MLIRNYETSLFSKYDCRAQVTMFWEAKYDLITETYLDAFTEAVKDTIGDSILNSDKIQDFCLTTEEKDSAELYRIKGKNLIPLIRRKYPKPCSLRIDLLGEITQTWIILIP